eukprot:scaffold36048_cov59-Phaeocystis_antarctica.AAC.7
MASARFLTSIDASHPAAAISRSCACERSKSRAARRETGAISVLRARFCGGESASSARRLWGVKNATRGRERWNPA